MFTGHPAPCTSEGVTKFNQVLLEPHVPVCACDDAADGPLVQQRWVVADLLEHRDGGQRGGLLVEHLPHAVCGGQEPRRAPQQGDTIRLSHAPKLVARCEPHASVYAHASGKHAQTERIVHDPDPHLFPGPPGTRPSGWA